MRSSPRVSWILCTNSQNDHLCSAIESCLNQTYEDFELIIVCNGKYSKELNEFLNSLYMHDKRVRIFDTDIRHLIFSLNLAIHYSRGEYIARMDSDDISISNRLEMQVTFLDLHKHIDVLGTNYIFIDSRGELLSKSNLPLDDSKIKRHLYYSNPICHPSVMMRKDTLCSLGGYGGGLLAEDYELWVRFVIRGNVNFANLDEPLLCYRDIGVSGARRAKEAYITMLGIQIKAFLSGAGCFWLMASMISGYKLLVRAKS